MRRSGWHTALLGFLAALFSGCDSQPALYPVTGKVVYKGSGEPLPLGGIVTFVSMSEPRVEASGRIEPDGSFTLEGPRGPGTVAGEHRVRLDPEVPDDPQSEANRSAARAKILAPRYLDAETSGLTVIVEPKGNVVTVTIDKP